MNGLITERATRIFRSFAYEPLKEGNKEDLIKKGLLGSEDFLIWEVEVQDWMEASILYNEFQAWGPYRPMREDA